MSRLYWSSYFLDRKPKQEVFSFVSSSHTPWFHMDQAEVKMPTENTA